MLVIPFTSCVKEVPLELVNKYYTAAEVRALPVLNYDPDGSPPDVRIDMKRASANFWEFSTNTVNNARSFPIFLTFPAEVLGTDERWQVRIVDEDLDRPVDEEIFFFEFHAVEDGVDNQIAFNADGRVVLSLKYNEQ